MNLIGSKLAIKDWITSSIGSFVKPAYPGSFFDVFAGTGVIGTHFNRMGWHVISCDLMWFNFIANYVKLAIKFNPYNHRARRARFNRLLGIEGFITKNYCSGGAKYFTEENGMKCDAILAEIKSLVDSNNMSKTESYYWYHSLVEAMDVVSNTTSVYGAYLKEYKKSACVPMELIVPDISPKGGSCHVRCGDSMTLLPKVKADIAYLDPPYNHRQYGSNYHVLETIARGDEPELYGTTRLRDYESQKSDFCSKVKALPTLNDYLQRLDTEWIILSYSSDGIMTEDEISDAFSKIGNFTLKKKEAKRYKSREGKNNSVLEEWLFCVRKG